ncbi:Os08g0236900 [Oryza sativa Japonica Group]|uniref:Os08g0236900 protein n=1 Tax=Oryza sativa subsp. japonica TaxID=39947 RepID=A0A0P0XDF3_ORYSJ|nr:Os08g0236900 [Oryza sativa Japonica Group]
MHAARWTQHKSMKPASVRVRAGRGSASKLKKYFFPGLWNAKTMEMQAILTVHFFTCQHRSPLDWAGVFRYQCLSAHGPRPAIVPTATFGAHSVGCVPKVIRTCGPLSW